MSNWFRLTPDGSLDREYLRICAVYRCIKRYGMSKETAITKLQKHLSEHKARQLVELWMR